MNLIETERLFLRPLTESDANQIYADWLNDPKVNQYLETRHSLQTVETCRNFIKHCNEDPGSHLFGVFLKENNQHIGNAKLGFISPYYSTGQLSLFIGDQASWGKGLATEIVCSLTDYGFKQLNLEKIEAGCYQENLGSLRVFMKSGYTVEGFLRNHVVSNGLRSGSFLLGILKHEFLKQY